MTQAIDTTAVKGAGATAIVPTIAIAQTVNNVDYSVSSYFGTCTIPAGVSQNANCVTPAVAGISSFAAAGTSAIRDSASSGKMSADFKLVFMAMGLSLVH